ncbi:MAG: tryptophan synthase subunit alpha [Desulfobacterales bacterium]|jgi:tryptophan synthase alpha chain|nr:tryptophan synthase subunit alpha [Desulfobacterales bacterium]MDZ7597263.1 tryptophan synthase subunit alpha [Desulfobacterales bacterium]
MLETYLRRQREKKDILLMTHIVVGYPSFEASFEIVKAMVAAGVDLMELQIPFSEPIADGPVILRANQEVLGRGARVRQSLAFAERVTAAFDIPFLFMTYCNIVFKYGVADFAAEMARIGMAGAIVADLPPEEGETYLTAMQAHQLAPIFIFSPTTGQARMRMLAGHGRGFIYCVARKGVTGQQTAFSQELEGYLARCRQATDLPLALGFGVKDRADIDFLRGKVDIAVIGTETIRLVDQHGVGAVEGFIRSLLS